MKSEHHIKKPRDLTTINSNDMDELLWWSHYLAISPERLLSVIQEAGNTVAEVKKHLEAKSK